MCSLVRREHSVLAVDARMQFRRRLAENILAKSEGDISLSESTRAQTHCAYDARGERTSATNRTAIEQESQGRKRKPHRSGANISPTVTAPPCRALIINITPRRPKKQPKKEGSRKDHCHKQQHPPILAVKCNT